jgi:hypothetical protein
VLDATRADPVLQRRQVLYPPVVPRAADAAEAERLAPWFALHGQRPLAVDIARYSDGGDRHAPETVAACRAILAGDGDPPALLYRHTGVQAQPLDPLLPSLMQRLSHRGAVHALRRTKGDADQTPGPAELALAAAMIPPGGAVLLIDDLQERVAAHGALRPAPVVLSLFLHPLARGA